MAVNPLFSGPGHLNKVSPRSSNGAVAVKGTRATTMYPAPCKKQRINGDGLQTEKDPFQDFEESFTADDLEQLDYIESQALSQMPKEHGTQQTMAAPVSVITGRKPSSDESSGYDSMTQNGNCPRATFSFKPLASRSPNVPVKTTSSVPLKFPAKQPVNPNQFNNQRAQASRQSNVIGQPSSSGAINFGIPKMYVGFQTSQGGLKSSPPIASSQNRYKKAGESHPTNRGIQHPQQSNVSIPLHIQEVPRSQGFSVSESSAAHQDFNSKQVPKHIASTTEMRFNLSAQTMQQGASGKTLTPPGGTSSAAFLVQEQEKLKEELKQLQAERYSKDGEIQVLRQNLGKTKTEISRLKIEKVEQEEKWRKEQNDKEKELVKELESLKTQLQFKERELAEAQGSYRNLEHRLQSNPIPSLGVRNPVTPPRSSPRFVGTALPKRAGEVPSPKQEGGFPTKESFMETNPALGSPSSVKMRLVEEGRGSPRSPKRVASRSPARSPKVTMATRRRMERMKATPRRDVTASSRVSLSSRYPQGHESSAQLIGHLLGQPYPQSYHSCPSTQGPLISTLQAASNNLDSRNLLRDSSENLTVGRPEDAAISKASNRNHTLAMRAISSLLDATSSHSVGNKTQQPLVVDNLPRPLNPLGRSTAILGVLPLLEDQLTEYLDALHAQMSVCASSIGSTCPTTTTNSSSGSRTVDGSLEGAAREELLRVERAETAALGALRNLHCLSCRSTEICLHIIRGSGMNGESGSSDAEDGDVSVMDIDPSAPLIDPTQAPRSSNSKVHPAAIATQQQGLSSATTYQGQPTPELPHCHILSRLVRIVGLQQPSDGGSGAVIVDTALRIILQLARSAPPDEAMRFYELFSSEVLYPYLGPDNPCATQCLVISILTALSKSWTVTQKFCSHTDSCLLLLVYQCANLGMDKIGSEDRIQLAFSVIDLLTNLTSNHEDGAVFLLDTDCQCSEEVVSSLVMMLSREYRAVDPEAGTECQRLEVVRRGLLPLHHLYMDGHVSDHRLEAEHQYNHIIAEMNRLVGRLPGIHRHEVGFLQDFDGSDEDDYQDSQEQASQMDVS